MTEPGIPSLEERLVSEAFLTDCSFVGPRLRVNGGTHRKRCGPRVDLYHRNDTEWIPEGETLLLGVWLHIMDVTNAPPGHEVDGPFVADPQRVCRREVQVTALTG